MELGKLINNYKFVPGFYDMDLKVRDEELKSKKVIRMAGSKVLKYYKENMASFLTEIEASEV